MHMKIKITNILNNKNFYIIVPMKEIDIKSKFDYINHISSLNQKIDHLEKEIKIKNNENNNLKQIINRYDNKIKELEKKIENL